MIVKGTVRGDSIILYADSSSSAALIRSAVASNSSVMFLSPYGNRFEPIKQGQVLTFKKIAGTSPTYEEVQMILRKIEFFNRIEHKTTLSILRYARQQLTSRLTFFYPNINETNVELSFCYNWASFAIDVNIEDNVLDELQENLLRINETSMRVTSEVKNLLTIHNYAMNGIYVDRKTFEDIADTLIRHNIIRPGNKNDFVVAGSAFSLASLLLMDARQYSPVPDENFSFQNPDHEDFRMGDTGFLDHFCKMLLHVKEKGNFKHLDTEQKALLRSLYLDTARVKTYMLTEHSSEMIENYLGQFEEDIKHVIESAAA